MFLGVLWILSSDELVGMLSRDFATLTRLQRMGFHSHNRGGALLPGGKASKTAKYSQGVRNKTQAGKRAPDRTAHR